jgi:hypothetical protein
MKASFPRKEAIPGCEPSLESLRPDSAATSKRPIAPALGRSFYCAQARAWRHNNGL